jgi:hypothetical protein
LCITNTQPATALSAPSTFPSSYNSWGQFYKAERAMSTMR